MSIRLVGARWGLELRDALLALDVSADAPQAFVKFLGEGSNRVPLSCLTIDEIKRAGCHWALAYPTSKRPSGVEDGVLMFVARLKENPKDKNLKGAFWKDYPINQFDTLVRPD